MGKEIIIIIHKKGREVIVKAREKYITGTVFGLFTNIIKTK